MVDASSHVPLNSGGEYPEGGYRLIFVSERTNKRQHHHSDDVGEDSRFVAVVIKINTTSLSVHARERVLFIGTQFSILYTSMYSPAEAATVHCKLPGGPGGL